MTAPPTADVVAAKALVFSALALRATIEERPNHPRAEELRGGSADWLREVGAWGLAVEPLEAEIFAAPLRHLPDGLLTDCRWAGEDVAVLGWALGLGEEPPEWEPVNVTQLTRDLGFMRDAGAAVLAEAALRPLAELRDYFMRVSVARWATHEVRLQRKGLAAPPALAGLRKALHDRLAEADIAVTDEDLATALAEEVERLGRCAPAETVPAPALLLVRQHAAEWLVGARAPFWDDASQP